MRARGIALEALKVVFTMRMKMACLLLLTLLFISSTAKPQNSGRNYNLVGTQQDACYDNNVAIACPHAGEAFHGQDAQRPGLKATYHDNQDGTILDSVTGLLWTKEIGEKVSWEAAKANASSLRIGGFDDWRLPTIKELYSLVDFRGHSNFDPAQAQPYINTQYFTFKYGDLAKGEPIADGEEWSSTHYTGRIRGDEEAVFGVNFADGSLKAYPLQSMKHYARYVRGPAYGGNKYEEGVGGVVLDNATQLVWQRSDDGKTRTWQEALRYCEGLYLAGRADWHLPTVKELQSIVDYERSTIPFMHPFFTVREPKGYFWTSTTHLEGEHPGSMAAYVAFGKALGTVDTQRIDVDGAGAVRSDPKSGDPDDFAAKGKDVRIKNYVRCVAAM